MAPRHGIRRLRQPTSPGNLSPPPGMTAEERDRLHGFAGYANDGTAVVYTLPPQRVDDAVTCTLGHEIMHIALGEYHK